MPYLLSIDLNHRAYLTDNINKIMSYALIHKIVRNDAEITTEYEIQLFNNYDGAYSAMAREYRSLFEHVDPTTFDYLEVLETHANILKPHLQANEILLFEWEWERRGNNDTFYIKHIDCPHKSFSPPMSFDFKGVISEYETIWEAEDLRDFITSALERVERTS